MATLQDIIQRAEALREETALNSISPERAGGIMYDTLLYINEMQLQESNPLLISKIYASVAAMEADDAPVSDLTGRPLRAGQVVCIVTGDPDDPDDGVIYRFDGIDSDSSSWTAVGRLGSDPYLEGYQYMGVATPSTNPGTPTQKVYYIASEPGSYTNFGGVVVNAGEVITLKFDGYAWTKEDTGVAKQLDLAYLDSILNKRDSVSLQFTPTNTSITPCSEPFYLHAGVKYTFSGKFNAQPISDGGHVNMYVVPAGTTSGSLTAIYIFTDDTWMNLNTATFTPSESGMYWLVYRIISGGAQSVSVSVKVDNPIHLPSAEALDNYRIPAGVIPLGELQVGRRWGDDDKPILSVGRISTRIFHFANPYFRISCNYADGYTWYLYVKENGTFVLKSSNNNTDKEASLDTSEFYIAIRASGGAAVTEEDAANCGLVITLLRETFEVVPKIQDGNVPSSDEDDPDMKDLYLGALVQQGYSATGLSGENAKRVTMQDVIAFPYERVTFSVKMPDGYFFGMRYGARATNLATNYFWVGNGDTFTIPADRLFYRVSFAKGNLKTLPNSDEDVPVSEIQDLIDTGRIRIMYKDTHDVVAQNVVSEKYVRAMMRQFYHDGTNNDQNGLMPNMALFGHTSDVHGDAKRFGQFLDYCDHLGVDAALVSGDMVASEPGNYCKFIDVLADKHNSMVLPCIGNHDARGLYTAQEQNEQIVGYLMTKNNVDVNSEETYPTYYYKDFTDKNIRLIVLNTHELERAETDGCNLTTTQMNWFVGVLASTPANYGILVMFHEPEAVVNKDNAHPEFYQPYHTHTMIYQTGITGSPISKIIDAFISRESATITYVSQSESRTITADFTNVDESIDFVAYVVGHEHIDWIGVLNGTVNRQLVLDIACGIALYGQTYKLYANLCDIPRGGESITQDAFNIYGIDLVNKTVRVSRIGSNFTPEAVDRKYMIIPYKF